MRPLPEAKTQSQTPHQLKSRYIFMDYIYLHGFASGPGSTKAKYFQRCFQTLGIALQIPDLNQDDFFHLTLTRQIQQVAALLPETATTLIGSSFGGLTAAWLAEHHPQVQRLILLAPAFQFLASWLPMLGLELERWRSGQPLRVYHYGDRQERLLDYGFLADAQTYDEQLLRRSCPTLILHGRDDAVIPIQASWDYASGRPWVTLIALDSDHSLGNVLPLLWQQIEAFCELGKNLVSDA